ncbi:hypothetical protein PWO55_08800 [Bacillus velezensis]|uniref:hypothetical protein n=1 Tax=Bacillus amyloliquefaciens group TaxID=1938374 RepID=UPI0016622E45|nr:MULTISPECIES: hypothetical protein [Bacillus amyloliquefaciens group]UXZ19681.1 hypothetical protein KI431_09275 [Bacillus siamensis]MCQ9151092.1 hypothetical protein [Bacillus amyloliquefaciens]QSZ44827.1 hypothetical protein I3J23_19075 [Bacillus amyloliquefaciens]URN32516.1 hypothetical protein M8561_09400 [Bacillus velezensis]USK15098.1 hypothetical protein LIT36_09320 [Bacillus velezensis]
MIILGIIAVLATFVFITALIFIFFEKTKKVGKPIAPISLVLALSLFFIMGAVNRDSHKSKTEDVTAATESTEEEQMYSEDEGDSYVQSVEDTKKEFNFSLGDFQNAYNEDIRALELDEDFKYPIPIKISADSIGDFSRENSKTYTRILAKEYDKSDGGYSLNAWFDKSKTFNGLKMTIFNSDDSISEKGIVAADSVFQALGIEFNLLKDFLKSEKVTLEVVDGDYLVTLAKIPSISLIINIEPK